MDFSVITEHSPLWIFPALLISVGLAYWQYGRVRVASDYTTLQRWVLGSIRFLLFAPLMILLISPMVRFTHHKKEKPLLIWAQDNSESLRLHGDSTYLTGAYNDSLLILKNHLSSKFDFLTLSFGEAIHRADTFSYKDKYTDFSQLFTRLREDLPGRNVGAMVLASDGLFNRGNHPRYSIKGFNYPIHTVTLGDTTRVRDVSLDKLQYNRVAYVNSTVPVRVEVGAHEFSGKKVSLEITSGSKVIHHQQVLLLSNDISQEITFQIPVKHPGLHHYKVMLRPLEGEYTTRNNKREMVVDVLEVRRKVLMLYDVFHPDMAALRGAIESNDNYRVELRRANKLVGSLKDFDLVVLVQLPSGNIPIDAYLPEIELHKLPVLLIVGAHTNLDALNKLGWGLEVGQSQGQYEEVLGEVNSQFTLFELDDYHKRVMEAYPPLLVPFGDFKIPANADVMMYQKIMDIKTQNPLVYFSDIKQKKQAVILGEGLWRWKINNFMSEKNHVVFNDVINHIVQYLSLNVRRDRLMVECEGVFSETQRVNMSVQLYNKSFQLINKPEMELLLKDSKGKEYRYVFARRGNEYGLDLGVIPMGDYHFVVSTGIGKKEIIKEGDFAVIPEDIESRGIRADHRVLNQISQLSGGESFLPGKISELEKRLIDDPSMIPVVYEERFFDSVLSYGLIGIFLLMLMSLEWFLRKYWGVD